LNQLDSWPGKGTESFEVAVSIGKLFAYQGRYAEAARYFQQALNKTKAARSIYLQHRALLAGAKVRCDLPVGAQVEGMVEKSVQLSQKGNLQGAAACAQEALQPTLEAQTLLGNVLFLSGDSKAALKTYDQVLEVNPGSPGALYARGATHFDRGERKLAIDDLQRYLSQREDLTHESEARALLTGASGREGPAPRVATPPVAETSTASKAASPPPLSPELIAAVQQTQQTPDFVAGLARTVEEAESALAAGRYQDALDRYKQVMPYQPNNGRFRAGMAWALVGLNRQPMGDRIWAVAVGSDPAAMEQLGDTLAKRGDARGAQALYRKLAESAPDYARGSGLRSKM
jgi:tetratricopeptide (TPR) repeat protein